MASPTTDYHIKLFHNAVSWISPPSKAMCAVQIQLTRRFQKHIRTVEGNVFGISDQNVGPALQDEFFIPVSFLFFPSRRDFYVLDQLRSLNLDFSTCNYLTPRIASFAFDKARPNGMNCGFSIGVQLEIITTEFLNEIEVLESLLLESVAEGGDSVQRGASKSAIEGLKKEKFDGGDKFTCAVCLEELSTGTEFTRLRCSHVFHHGCIIKWLAKSNTCPVCRYVVPDPD